MKRYALFLMTMLLSLTAQAVVPHRPVLPEVPGYMILRGDCHIHTVFSDDTTWPTVRVDEAAFDGLDFIAITDHCETRHQNMLKNGTFRSKEDGGKVDRNTSYEIAASAAKKYGIYVIHGTEITRGKCLFPGHFNALFIQDANLICSESEKAAAEAEAKGASAVEVEEAAIMAGLKEARRQGAYLQWNHPDWERQAQNETVWWPIHSRILEAGLMDGIEVVNHFTGFDKEAFGWVVEKKLNMTAGTDCHQPMFQLIDYEKGEYRPMTLAFVKEGCTDVAAGLRAAMDERRCCILAYDSMYGPQELLEAFAYAAIEIKTTKQTAKRINLSIKNKSSVPIILTKAPGSENIVYPRRIVLNAGEEMNWNIAALDTAQALPCEHPEVNFFVENFCSAPDKPIKISYTF